MPISFPKKPGIVAYLTAGDPDLAATREIALAAIDNGADVIELGVPFSDPLADGPVIQRASQRAVAKGTTLAQVLGLAAELRKARPSAGLVLFSYLNPVVRMGMKAFCAKAAEADADGSAHARAPPSSSPVHRNPVRGSSRSAAGTDGALSCCRKTRNRSDCRARHSSARRFSD